MEASEIRLRARNILKEKYWNAVLVAFVASIFGALVTSSGGLNISLDLEEVRDISGIIPERWFPYLISGFSLGGVQGIVSFVLGGVVQMGYARYLLNQHDGQEGTVKDLFSMFDYFKAGFLQSLLRSLFIILWSLLLVIPGIVMSYAYAMTPFILAEHPEMTAREAIRASKDLMKGHKFDLFCLNLSFIGWILLCVLTAGIGFIFLSPYMNAAHAVFYRNITHPDCVTAQPTVEF